MAEDTQRKQDAGTGPDYRLDTSSGSIDLRSIPNDMELVIRRTRGNWEATVQDATDGTRSFAETRNDFQSPSRPESRQQHQKPERRRNPRSIDDGIGSPGLHAVQKGIQKKYEQWRNLDSVKYGRTMQVGAAGAAAGLLPSFYLGSGLSTLSWGAIGATGLALSLPVLGYMDGKKRGNELGGAALGSASGAALYAMGGGSLNAIGTTMGAVALPAGLAYAGYKLGSKNGRPLVGALTGAGAGMVAAPVVSSAIAGGSGGWLGALTGAASGAGTSLLYAGVAGASAAAVYGLGYANKKLGVRGLSRQNTGLLGTAAQSVLLPISGIVRGAQWAKRKWNEKRAA